MMLPQRGPRLVGEGDAFLRLARPPPWPSPPRPPVSCWTWRMTSPISLVASTERSASLRTSSATTAKPRPASPARAASMAAFRASRFVWSAISSITSRILPISCERLPRPVMTRAVFSMFSEMVFMPWTVRDTASPPLRASSLARALMRSASSAILATSLTAEAMSLTVTARPLRGRAQRLGVRGHGGDEGRHLLDRARGLGHGLGQALQVLGHLVDGDRHLLDGGGGLGHGLGQAARATWPPARWRRPSR